MLQEIVLSWKGKMLISNKKAYESLSLTGKGKYIVNRVDQSLKLIQMWRDKNNKINHNYNKKFRDTHKDAKYDTKIKNVVEAWG